MDTFLPRHLSALLPECLAASLPYCPFLPPSPLIPPRLHSFLPRQSTFLSSSLPAQLLQSTRNLGHQATLFSPPPLQVSSQLSVQVLKEISPQKKAASKLPESPQQKIQIDNNKKKKKGILFLCPQPSRCLLPSKMSPTTSPLSTSTRPPTVLLLRSSSSSSSPLMPLRPVPMRDVGCTLGTSPMRPLRGSSRSSSRTTRCKSICSFRLLLFSFSFFTLFYRLPLSCGFSSQETIGTATCVTLSITTISNLQLSIQIPF